MLVARVRVPEDATATLFLPFVGPGFEKTVKPTFVLSVFVLFSLGPVSFGGAAMRVVTHGLFQSRLEHDDQ